jgi:hypothetical protein
VLLKRHTQLRATSADDSAVARERGAVDAELATLGGLAAYQEMSATATRGGSAAQILTRRVAARVVPASLRCRRAAAAVCVLRTARWRAGSPRARRLLEFVILVSAWLDDCL